MKSPMNRLLLCVMLLTTAALLAISAACLGQGCTSSCGCQMHKPYDYNCNCAVITCQCSCGTCVSFYSGTEGDCHPLMMYCSDPADCACLPGEQTCGKCGNDCEGKRCFGISQGCPCGQDTCGVYTPKCAEQCAKSLSTECGAHRDDLSSPWEGGGTTYPCVCPYDDCPKGENNLCKVVRCSKSPAPVLYPCNYNSDTEEGGSDFCSCHWGTGCPCDAHCAGGGDPACGGPGSCPTNGCQGNDCGCGSFCPSGSTPCGL